MDKEALMRAPERSDDNRRATKKVSMRLDADALAEIDDYAELTGTNRTELMQRVTLERIRTEQLAQACFELDDEALESIRRYRVNPPKELHDLAAMIVADAGEDGFWKD